MRTSYWLPFVVLLVLVPVLPSPARAVPPSASIDCGGLHKTAPDGDESLCCLVFPGCSQGCDQYMVTVPQGSAYQCGCKDNEGPGSGCAIAMVISTGDCAPNGSCPMPNDWCAAKIDERENGTIWCTADCL